MDAQISNCQVTRKGAFENDDLMAALRPATKRGALIVVT